MLNVAAYGSIMAEDDIWDSWEDFADSNDLDQHVNQYLKLSNGDLREDEERRSENPGSRDRSDDQSNSYENGTKARTQFRILQRPVVVHEDDQNRTAYTPQVKILRRPGKDMQGNEDRNKEKQKSQPSRTLAEREAAYAEARKRIMGPAVSQGNSSSGGGGKSRSEHRKTRSNKSTEGPQNNAVQVQRMPKGPDKTKGFSSR